MQDYYKDGTHYRLFDSVSDLVDTVQTINDPQRLRTVAFDSSKTGRNFSTWAEIYRAAFQSWEVGVVEVERMAKELEGAELPAPICRKRRVCWSMEDGDEVDRDRIYAGQEYWRSSHRPYVEGEQVVTIAIDVNAQANIGHKDILWRGAAALAMTRILEDAGYRVELLLVHQATEVYQDGSGHLHVIRLKEAQDPLDIGTLVAAVSGWFYRTLLFRAKYLSGGPVDHGLGTPIAPSWYAMAELHLDNPIIISGSYSFWGSKQLAKEALAKFATPEPVEEEPEPDTIEEVAVPEPKEPPKPPKPMTAAERRREEAAQRKREREWERWRKQWAKTRREA